MLVTDDLPELRANRREVSGRSPITSDALDCRTGQSGKGQRHVQTRVADAPGDGPARRRVSTGRRARARRTICAEGQPSGVGPFRSRTSRIVGPRTVVARNCELGASEPAFARAGDAHGSETGKRVALRRTDAEERALAASRVAARRLSAQEELESASESERRGAIATRRSRDERGPQPLKSERRAGSRQLH